jgi:hypothetical protein
MGIRMELSWGRMRGSSASVTVIVIVIRQSRTGRAQYYKAEAYKVGHEDGETIMVCLPYHVLGTRN